MVEAEALCSPDVTHRANPSRQRGRTTGAPFASEMPDIAETISLDHKIEAVLTAAVADCDSTPGVDVAADPRRARNVCSCATTAAPSPIAAPTRFTEPDRTSPIAKIPTTPVSSASRTRSGEGTSAPVWMGDAASGEPRRGRVGAGEDEQMRDGLLLLGSRAAVAPAHALQPLVGRPGEFHDFGVADHVDVGASRNAVDQVARHGL